MQNRFCKIDTRIYCENGNPVFNRSNSQTSPRTSSISITVVPCTLLVRLPVLSSCCYSLEPKVNASPISFSYHDELRGWRDLIFFKLTHQQSYHFTLSNYPPICIRSSRFAFLANTIYFLFGSLSTCVIYFSTSGQNLILSGLIFKCHDHNLY